MLRWTAEDGLGRVQLRLKTKRFLMLVLRRRLVLLACVFLSVASLLGSSDRVYGQSSGGPSSDQIEMFQNLTPDQQQAIIQSLGGSGGLGSLGGLGGLSGSGSSSSDRSRSGLNGDNQDSLLNRNRRPSDEDEEKEPAIPVLRGDDWVIIEVGFHLAPRATPSPPPVPGAGQLPTPQNLQAYQAAAAAQGANANQN